MRSFSLYQVDSFTRRRFTGNPAGVVPDADGLSAAEMQLIAREVNASETAFILSDADGDSDVRVRFFTPTTEVPVCGHATIAAHFVRRLRGAPLGRLRQKTGAGVIPIDIEDQADGTLVWMTQRPAAFEAPLGAEVAGRIALALGAQGDDLDPELPTRIVSTGHSKILIPLREGRTLTSLAPDASALVRLSRELGCNGFYPFVFRDGEAHARMFAPAIGIVEDPVTGMAAGPLAAYLVDQGRLTTGSDGRAVIVVRQGEEIGRPGSVAAEVRRDAATDSLQVRIAGAAVLVFEARVEV